MATSDTGGLDERLRAVLEDAMQELLEVQGPDARSELAQEALRAVGEAMRTPAWAPLILYRATQTCQARVPALWDVWGRLGAVHGLARTCAEVETVYLLIDMLARITRERDAAERLTAVLRRASGRATQLAASADAEEGDEHDDGE